MCQPTLGEAAGNDGDVVFSLGVVRCRSSYFDAATAQRLFDQVLSVGNSVPPEQAFRAFRGRDVDTAALMRDRGLA